MAHSQPIVFAKPDGLIYDDVERHHDCDERAEHWHAHADGAYHCHVAARSEHHFKAESDRRIHLALDAHHTLQDRLRTLSREERAEFVRRTT